MSGPNSRVIVIGGGPVGLMAAHILAKTGLDFVVLERGSSIYPELGASLALWPQTFRILDQLNLLDVLKPHESEMLKKIVLTQEGTVYRHSNNFIDVEKK
jgi:2-polyprenyl-6-methoxyphenol hydroxylase-like FAD-dependent oxidoreductase